MVPSQQPRQEANIRLPNHGNLHLESARLSATTSLLELAALGSDVRLLVLVRTEAEMLVNFSVLSLSPQYDGIGSSRRAERELIKSDDLSTGFQYPLPGRGRHSKGGNGELRDLDDTNIVGDGAD